MIDQRRAADGALRVAHRPAADHEMHAARCRWRDGRRFRCSSNCSPRSTRADGISSDLQRRDAVGVKDVAQRAQLLDRHARPVAQHLLGGRIGEQDVSLGVDDQHRLRHAVEGALQHGGRKPELVMGGDQMLGALGDRGLQRLVGGLGGAAASSCSSRLRAAGSPASARWRGAGSARRRRGRSPAGHVPVRFGFGASRGEQLRSSADRLFEVAGDRRPSPRGPRLADERRDRGVVSGDSQPDQFAVDRNLALPPAPWSPRSAASRSGLSLTASIRPASAGRIASLASRYSLANSLIAGDREAARRALRPAQQRAHVRDLLQHPERMVDGGGIGPRLDVQADRGGADDEEDGEASSENDALRGHCRLLTSLFRVARGSSRRGDALIDRGQQRVRREGLAQAACRAEFDGHPQEIRRAIGVGEGVARHRDDRARPALARETSGSIRSRAYAA